MIRAHALRSCEINILEIADINYANFNHVKLKVSYLLQDYSETEQLSNKMKEDNIFIYNQSQNPSSGSIGIACIALAIICRSENPTSDVDESYEHLFKSDNFSKVVSANIINSSGKFFFFKQKIQY